MNPYCSTCGGEIGRECFNPNECAQQAADMDSFSVCPRCGESDDAAHKLLEALHNAYRAWKSEEGEAIDVIEAVASYLGDQPDPSPTPSPKSCGVGR